MLDKVAGIWYVFFILTSLVCVCVCMCIHINVQTMEGQQNKVGQDYSKDWRVESALRMANFSEIITNNKLTWMKVAKRREKIGQMFQRLLKKAFQLRQSHKNKSVLLEGGRLGARQPQFESDPAT